jgi:hypothetical protein
VANQAVQKTIDAVNAADTVIDSATVFINSVPGLIQTSVQQALANGATAAELQPVSDLADTLTAKAGALQAAVVANTPAAPPGP